MAFTCGFFNSVAHDRKYDAVQHGMIFDGIITDGIYATYLKAMVVKASENASEVIVQPGRAWFNHTWSYNDSDYPVAAPEPEVVLDRIDTLVLDVNSEDAVRNNQFLWVQGTPTSQTPEPPELIHTATHNQYPLCDVYRQAGTTMIYAADITNRVGTSDCPFVTGVLESIDIDDLLAQWDDEFHTWENATKASFEGWMVNQQSVYTAWFTALKTQMAGDVADVEAWVQTIKDIIDEETATHLQLEIDEINSMLPSGSHITVTTSDTELYSRTVTITDEDNNTVTSQFDANGVAVFKSVPYVGTLTITSTDGVRTATEVVNTPYFARYEFTLAFWSATVNIIGDSVFGGDTVTITDSTTALVGTVVLNASGAGVFNATYPDTYKFSVTHGGETMEVSLAVTQETTYNVEIHSGLNYQAWLNAGRVSKSFSSLDEVLEDEKTLRQLFLVHDAVDYICDSFNASTVADITKIFNTDLAAKRINLSDYALDHFYAVADIKSIMDTADKYGYGEWVITDDTTTPPTWGPKGNVPKMTSTTAPYGASSMSVSPGSGYESYKIFDRDPQTRADTAGSTISNARIYYKFTNPTNVRRAYLAIQTSGGVTRNVKWQYSDDGITWTDAKSETITQTAGYFTHYTDIPDCGYHLYWAHYFVSANVTVTSFGNELQFYGRELKVSVPPMTSNTAPFGEVSASGYYDTFYPWRAFSGSNASNSDCWYVVSSSGWLKYSFVQPIIVKQVMLQNRNHSTAASVRAVKDFVIEGSNDDTNWTSLGSSTNSSSSSSALTFCDLNNDDNYLHIRFRFTSTYGSGETAIGRLQFYGLDYSEKEFEPGTTKKWLYDHGVELETASPVLVGNNTVATKNEDNLYIEIPASASRYAGFVFPSISLTPFSLLRGVLDDTGYASNNSNAFLRLTIEDTASPTYGTTSLAVATFLMSDTALPNNLALNISSINQNGYPTIGDNNASGTVNKKASIKELWLE